ncbi:glutaredoxin [Capsicum annuum]|nr:glutaredoxin [Capsicum annuum]
MCRRRKSSSTSPEIIIDVAEIIINVAENHHQHRRKSLAQTEFEELEAVPSMSVMDGPLEPSSTTSNTADVPDDRSFVNFFSNAMRIGSGPNAGMQGQPYDSSAVVLPPPRPPAVPPSSAPALSPSSPLSTSSTLMPVLDAPEPDTNSRRSSNLVKPSSFFGPPPSSSPLIPPVSSAVPTAPPLQSPGNLQRHYGAPLLQPFPPPNLPPSLTPYTAPGPNNGHVINRDKVREALLMLVQKEADSSSANSSPTLSCHSSLFSDYLPTPLFSHIMKIGNYDVLSSVRLSAAV